MPATELFTAADIQRAEQIWADYQRVNDVSARKGQAVGIDPHSGEVFFGDSATDISRRLEAEGQFRPLFLMRVGSRYYGRLRWGRRL